MKPSRILLIAITLLWVATGTWHTFKPLPAGTNIDSGDIALAVDEIDFLRDITYRRGTDTVHEQEIFNAIFAILDEAHTVAVLDFFLFSDQAGSSGASLRALSSELKDRLVTRKRAQPGLKLILVTDPINDVYGSDPSPHLQELAAAGIEIVSTDLRPLRDSNPGYSAFWRIFVQWWGNSPAIRWLPNPFADGPSRISLRSWLALLNFKANHRKLIVADRADGRWVGLVTSGNPHDASSAHSNVAFRFSGTLPVPILASEINIARFSGSTSSFTVPELASSGDDYRAAFVTEKAIRDRLLVSIGESGRGDAIDIAMFYLADRYIIEALLAAADRGARIRLILDPNKDAFGIEKDGVPNRPVAHELVTASDGAINVRWYQTHGEQFHTKLVIIVRGDRVIASLGSANLTRRNLGNYNLEANVQIDIPRSSPLAGELLDYFDRLWQNEDDDLYTVPFEAYQDDSRWRYWRYRLMEATGLSTF